MPRIVEKNLTKGQLRKLNSLRKSLGKKIADDAFSKWLKKEAKPTTTEDPHIVALEKAVARLIGKGLKVPPSGIKISRGRGGLSVKKIAMTPRKSRQKTARKKAN